MKKSHVAVVLFFNGVAYMSCLTITYIHYMYYVAMQGSMGLTNTQLGVIGTISGIMGTIGFAASGLLADKFTNTKKLLAMAYGTQAVLLLIYATLPSWKFLVILQTVGALTGIGLYWAAMAKFVRSLGGKEVEGRMYGLFFSSMGIGNVIVGFLAAGLIAKIGPGALKYILIYHSCFLTFVILLNAFLYKPVPVKISEDEKFKLTFIKDILSMPLFWMVSFLYFAVYFGGAALSYFSPLMTSSYGLPLAMGTVLATIRIHLGRIFLAPLGGYAIDKCGSSIKVLGVTLVIGLVAIILTLVFPRNAEYLVVAVIAFTLLVITYNVSVPAWFTPLTEINIPEKMRGTAVGLYSALGCSSDIFIYILAGMWLDKYGNQTGYTIIFSLVGTMFVLGILVSFIAWFTLKKKRAAESALAAPPSLVKTVN